MSYRLTMILAVGLTYLAACGDSGSPTPERPADAAAAIDAAHVVDAAVDVRVDAAETPDAAPVPTPDAAAVDPADAAVFDADVMAPDAEMAPDATAAPDAAAPDAGPVADVNGCAVIFDQGLLPEYEIDISDAEWVALDDEFLNWAAREAMGLDPNPWHPIGFHYQGGPLVPDVMIRLKGQSSWHQAVLYDANPKMQFVISFNEVDHAARFEGLRKIELDMPRNDRSFLRQRLALHYLRGVGVDAQCANSARLVINGAYYGLYTNLERLDKEFLQRRFLAEDEGDLWEGAVDIKTNELTFTWDRLVAFWLANTTAQLDALCDLDASVTEWAAESMLNDADGYYGGKHNFYLYDHPSRGFLWIPHDLDATFDFQPADSGAVFWSRTDEPAQQYMILMSDPIWQEQFITDLESARAGYDVAVLDGLLTTWTAQIDASATDDPHRPFTMAEHDTALLVLRDAVADRAAYVDGWFDCRAFGGADLDGDGYDFCHDCQDDDATVHPGAPELVNELDDDCDGYVD